MLSWNHALYLATANFALSCHWLERHHNANTCGKVSTHKVFVQFVLVSCAWYSLETKKAKQFRTCHTNLLHPIRPEIVPILSIGFFHLARSKIPRNYHFRTLCGLCMSCKCVKHMLSSSMIDCDRFSVWTPYNSAVGSTKGVICSNSIRWTVRVRKI